MNSILKHLGGVAAIAGILLLTACGPDREETEDYQVQETEQEATEPTVTGTPPGGTGTPGTETTGTDAGSVEMEGSETSDEALEQRIRARLAQGDLAMSEEEVEQIEIDVQEDTVSLSGTVPSETASRNVEERVREVDGVETVENNLMASR